MTKKDYVVIARGVCLIEDKGKRAEYVRALCGELRADNSRFNEARFMVACGL
jgi:16S rRNA G527 N7-methylase RsmG